MDEISNKSRIENKKNNIFIVPATIENYPTIQNMARFYVYDRTLFWTGNVQLMECLNV